MSFEQKPNSRTTTATVTLLLVLMGVLMGGSVRRESVTIDEIAHVGAGVSYLQKLDLRMNVEHPPLAKVIAAIPLVVRGVHADYSNVSWSFSNGFFYQYLGEWVFGHWLITRWNDPGSTMFLARMPMLLLTLVLGYILYRYGSKFGTVWGGVLCLAAYATMPAFIAFGPLVQTDVPFTLFSLVAMWIFADLWRSPSRATVLKFGFALASALLSKFTAGILFFCFLAFILSLRFRRVADMPSDKAELRAWRRRRWWGLIQGTFLAALICYAVYFVLSWHQPTDSFNIIPHFPPSPLLRRLLMPPWIFLQGLATFGVTASRATYILGHTYPHGEWFYFPILFFLKSPLAFIVLLLLAWVVRVLAKRRLKEEFLIVPKEMVLHWRAVRIFLLVFIAACMLSRLTISIRHFFVPMVLLILLLAPLPGMLIALQRSGWPTARAGIWLTAVLVLASLLTAVRAYPYYMPYLGSLSMGRPGYQVVNDSNLDWNQSLPDVEQWVQRKGIQRVLIDEYSFSEPEVYVPQARFWNCQEPAASDGGQWAVLSTSLIADGHNCRWLLQYPHEILAGGSMYGFQLPAVIPEMGAPGGPPLPADRHAFGGLAGGFDFRLVILNCIRDPNQLQPTMDRMQAMQRSPPAKK